MEDRKDRECYYCGETIDNESEMETKDGKHFCNLDHLHYCEDEEGI